MFVLFQITSFLSAFLLFVIQPVMAKALLPALGGSALVWGTCLVSFQGMLFLGYLASHRLLGRWDVRHYVWVHAGALALAMVVMRPFGVVTATVPGPPWWAALLASVAHVGLPFFLLSFSTPLLQRWLAALQCPQPVDPYRLFSTSNAGSLAALLAYPFFIEPFLSLSHQSQFWRLGLLVMVGLLVALRLTSRWEEQQPSVREAARTVRGGNSLRVFSVSAGSCALLLSVTNAITFDISSAPLLWVLPLALYLTTFIVVYKRRPWINDRVARGGLPWWVSLGLILFLMGRYHLGFPGVATVLCHLAVVTFGCWLAHARLAQLKPADDRALTAYYVAMSAGGLVGSVLVSWIVPILANTFVEYPLSIAFIVAAVSSPVPLKVMLRWCLAATLLTGALLLGSALATPAAQGPVLGFAVVAGILLLLSLARRQASWLTGVALAVGLVASPTKDLLWDARASQHYRNHYGIYEISESGKRRYITHGTTNHGIQNLDPATRAEPLSYYHRGGPAGEILASLEPEARHFGMIGLGAGALVAYARGGDVFEIYELDPLNIRLAKDAFHYLEDRDAAGVDIRIHAGDGRLLLAGVRGQFDVLILDAFSSGAIPMHLLTIEAMEAYLASLKPDGFLLLHISNRALRLRPMIASVGRALGKTVYFKDSLDSPEDADLKSSDWALLASDAERARRLADRYAWLAWEETSEGTPLPRPWSDAVSDLRSVLRW